MKLIFSRFGGKKTKSREIIEEFGDHKIYVEAFLGSGAIFLEKESSSLSVLNDLDPAIYNIFEGAKNHSQSFDEQEWSWIPDREKWIQFKENIISDSITDPTEKIYQSLYFIRHSWSGLGQSFTPSRWKNNETYKIQLGNYKEKLTNTIVSKRDYREVINEYDSEDTLFYLDPPYEVAVKKDYYEHKNGFNMIELRDTLKHIRGKFVLSLDITDEITELFKDFNCKTLQFNYQTRKRNKDVKEYIIKNF